MCGDRKAIWQDIEGTLILISGVRSAPTKISSYNAAGIDRIVIKLLSALDDFGTDKIMEINEIWYG